MKRIGVAGLGLIGVRHARAVMAHPDLKLVAAIDPNKDMRAAVDAPGFDRIEDAPSDLDGIIIATPTGMHADNAAMAAARGWSMLIEKPISDTVPEADRLVRAVSAGQVPALVGHHRRQHPRVQLLRDMVQGGAIGRPVTGTCIWAMKKPDAYFQGNWREGLGGSPVMINLVHDLDLLRYVFGPVADIQGIGSGHIRGANRVESGALILQFTSGFIAAISFADTTPSPWGFEAGIGENPNIATTEQDMMWITGTEGGLSFPSMTVWSGASDWSEKPDPSVMSARETDPLAAQLNHFIDVIDGKTPPIVTVKDARETLAIALAAEALLWPETVGPR